MSDKNENQAIDLTASSLEESVVVISDDEMNQSAWTAQRKYGKRKRDTTIDIESDSNESDGFDSESSRLIAEEGRQAKPRAATASPTEEDMSSGGGDEMDTSWADLRERQDLPARVPDVIGSCSLDGKLPDTVSLLTTPWGSKVYLVGTAHFSHESQEDVAQVIRAVQPDYVVVELCQSRSHMLTWDEEQILNEAKSVNYSMIRDMVRSNGLVHGTMYLMLLSVSAHITRELGMAPGGEFRRAFREAQQVPKCVIHLGDRPIHVTLRRALASLSWWQSIKLAFHLLLNKDPIKKEDVERCKERDILEEMMAEMAGEYPEMQKVFVDERDVYLTYSLENAALMEPGPRGPLPCKVVGVVGIGHVPGITAHWGKLSYKDIPSIMTVPPPSRSSRVVRFTLKASLIGLVLYTLHKLTPAALRPPLPSLPSLPAITSGLRNFSSNAVDYFQRNN